MKQEIVLHHLEELAEKLSVKISYEDLKKERISFPDSLYTGFSSYPDNYCIFSSCSLNWLDF